MNYIYDILLNFNNEYYEFYDWNNEDKLTHIRKIPIFKVSDDVLKNIIMNEVIVSEDLLKRIKNKTEVFSKNYIDILNYSCLLCNDKKVIGIRCNDKGKVIGKSDLLIDEHNEIIEILDRYDLYNLDYKITTTNEVINFKTRKEVKMQKFIMREIDRQPTNKLEYLLYECSNENCGDREAIIEKIKESLNSEHINDIYEFLRMATNRKRV
jgi:hypothetical protein